MYDVGHLLTCQVSKSIWRIININSEVHKALVLFSIMNCLKNIFKIVYLLNYNNNIMLL